ncbi:hypothetical protein SASPL_139190 [Salvia splendens]|uniref:Uncharacterized protein n=1 Tax=Salvia splendens TaxID=180675 RepID=A0A8X8ZEL0_SALSN|nr:hypothetical protein SASPL_139190 [Salvia splendens]
MTMTTIFFGGAVATKPATATTRHNSQLAVRASMDLEKVVAAAAETTNTRRGLVLAGMAIIRRKSRDGS